MIKTSAPGKDESGYILLDVLIALLVASIGFASVFGAVSTAAGGITKLETNLMEAIEIRNLEDREFERKITF